ncbi:hypothetical protein OAA86_08150 [Rhodospirillales bacterium]|nr:hypothetical protein [Rhodospirillales bacterium]
MQKLEDKIEDDLGDEISNISNKMMAKRTWDGECVQFFEELKKLLDKKKYKAFDGDCRRYFLTRKGETCLFDVPTEQRGFLEQFKGKRIRLICMGGWNAYSDRWYRVAKV